MGDEGLMRKGSGGGGGGGGGGGRGRRSPNRLGRISCDGLKWGSSASSHRFLLHR